MSLSGGMQAASAFRQQLSPCLPHAGVSGSAFDMTRACQACQSEDFRGGGDETKRLHPQADGRIGRCVLGLSTRVTVEDGVAHLDLAAADARNGNSGGNSGGDGGGGNAGGGSGQGNSGGRSSEGGRSDGRSSEGRSSEGRSAKSSTSTGSQDEDQSGDSAGISDGNGGSLSTSGGMRATTISIRHANGTVERIVGGRYEMRDSRSRTIVNRNATAADRSRLEGLTR